jgi:hypothetical protein
LAEIHEGNPLGQFIKIRIRVDKKRNGAKAILSFKIDDFFNLKNKIRNNVI